MPIPPGITLIMATAIEAILTRRTWRNVILPPRLRNIKYVFSISAPHKMNEYSIVDDSLLFLLANLKKVSLNSLISPKSFSLILSSLIENFDGNIFLKILARYKRAERAYFSLIEKTVVISNIITKIMAEIPRIIKRTLAWIVRA
ncbi:144aa long hypothetical protein [Pyrococcus horikoshii OT3]|uniref:Uncharacterized protein n=1 Tax=Pyrococcus horikoshii (strain ATCC 700860 / DSM 12428 / JCM 9974 / NBRC 100139 / OT-3) TaxID=70601 RepID=O57714_PYRHO|nr:144aa long hypothetical protein [Pyrococcus horikoshii OT3]